MTDWKPWLLGTSSLVGHVSVDFSGWVIHRVPVFRKADGSLSVGTPSAPEIDADGHVRMRDGKRQYWPVITLENNEARERWQRAILAALAAGGITGEVQS
jgi:hypothetical protein